MIMVVVLYVIRYKMQYLFLQFADLQVKINENKLKDSFK